MESNAVHRYSQLLVILGLVCSHFSGATGRYDSCGQGWIQYKNYCYLLVESNLTWSEAKSKCLQRSSELTSIHSQEENQFILSRLPKNSRFWIGIESLKPGKDNHWTDNSSLNFLGFSAWSEALWKLSSGLCVYIEEKSGDWKTSDCLYISDSGYICKRHVNNEPVDTQSQFKVACTGESSRTCYTLYTESIPWEEAQRLCREQNQSLVTITDRQTFTHIQTVLGAHSISIWTGLSFYNGSLQWDSGIGKDPYPWISGDMVRLGCVALTSFVWETQDCNTSLPFMCEDRQDTSSDISTSRRSGASIIRSELSTQWMSGLYPLLTNTSNEILIDTEESDGSAPGYDRLRSLVIRQARVRPSCPTDWIQSLGICFKVISEAESWHVARHHCESLGADLPSIHSEVQNEYITFIRSKTNGNVWIGLHDLSNETVFEWTDGTPFNFSRWAPTKPNGLSIAEDCVELYHNGLWNDINCYTTRPYICVKKLGSTTIRPFMTTTEAPRCAESGWLYHGGFCYFISDETKTWSEAQDVCRNKGAELVSVHSQDENNFLLYQLRRRNVYHTYYWIGLFKKTTKVFRWSDESPFDFVAWNGGEIQWFGLLFPHVCARTKSEHALWFSSNCSEAFKFICKKSNSSAVTLPFRLTTIASITNPTVQLESVCPKRFFSRDDVSKCVYIGGYNDKSLLTWDEAKETCTNMSSQTKVQLASITSAEEQAFLNVLMGFVDNPAWIGLKSSEFGDVSDWQDNSRVNFSNWLDEQFQYDEGSSDRELCVQILGKNFFETLGKWYRGDCESKADYICETEKLYIPVVVTSDSTLTSIPDTAPGFPKSSATLLLCPKKFQKFHTFCYLVVSHLETWDEARTSCEARGADLAKTEHILQLSKITLLLADYGVKKQAWIGIKQTNGSRFHWTDGKPVRRFFWRDEKNSFNSSGGLKTFCVSLFDSKWIRSDCNEKQPYICQTKLVRPTATVPLHNNQTLCKDGKSVQHGEYCYLKTKHQVSWSEADHVCRHRGMQLVSIHSNSQKDFLVNYTQHTSETLYYWIGLVSYKNGSFHWADGSSMTYINWDEDSSENSKHSDEKCAVMDSKKGRWYPVDCFTQSHGYICSSHAKNVNMLAGSEHLGSSISGGGVAAIVIVVLSACCLFIFALVYAVRRRTRRPASDGQVLQSNGFDNRLYVCSDHVNEEESLACS